ncbi:MFS transporter [Frankia nepalensis]|uniref:MFS transporter n=1 Tax=Frankia nepalensis TaxID=1836974 RepID=A0A937RN69_9ACTN|nr:MFS transporter [Frankia nepalensis]MBL7502561.1 MFS transporter [Frankia nepalensis]MBL7515148.1 MFS transporter [Frankia nepalensis]MBL7633157.1 MFS transporter [Frankia nepalensis]
MASNRYAVLTVACLATFAINLDTNIVNVALPSLSRELGASTRDLQWVVDAYNLAFAALVLGAGSLGDRFGRRPALIAGLLGFAITSGLGALCTTSGQLTAARTAMGVFAALIFPTTLSIITNAFPDRRERARAIGVWGAVTGVAVAIGPVTGGLLLEHFWWGSVFVALVPAAVVTAGLAAWLVPESRDPAAPGIDVPGVIAGSATIGLLVYTIIEAPHRGWDAPLTTAGFVATAGLAAAFLVIERRAAHPMLDVSVFANRAFTAASMSVTVAFFALFGFIFLVTQYFQVVRGYGPLSTGVRILPVAGTIAIGSAVGPLLVARLGTRPVVMTGLTLLGGSFAWIASSPLDESYLLIVGQMVLMGLGLGLTQVPATDSILSVLPAAKAGVGSAINDATREAGGTLGVAVVGSVYASIFANQLSDSSFAQLPAGLLAQATSSVGAALGVAEQAGGGPLVDAVHSSFLSAFHVGCIVGAAVCWAGALAASALPGRPRRQVAEAEATPRSVPA